MPFFLWLILRKNFWELLKTKSKKKTMIWRRYIVDYIFFIWQHGQESLNVFIDQVNMFQPIMKFTAEYSKEQVNFLDLNINLLTGNLRQICLLNPQIL